MWIVQLALRRPYTFVIMSMMIVILGGLAIVRMPTDIFPEIDIPVVSVIWSYGGISPEEMAEAITVRSERGFTVSVNDIEHMESESLPGLGIIKIFFHPRAKIEAAVAQICRHVAIFAAFSARRAPGRPISSATTPPACPSCSSAFPATRCREQQLYDYGYNFIRTQLANIQGATFPLPYGGKPRQISVDLDPRRALRARHFRQRCRQRNQQAEPDSAFRLGEDRAARNIP